MMDKTITDEQLKRIEALGITVEKIVDFMEESDISAEHAISCYEAILRGEPQWRM